MSSFLAAFALGCCSVPWGVIAWWWLLVVGWFVVVFLFVLGACRVAGEADDRAERAFRERAAARPDELAG